LVKVGGSQEKDEESSVKNDPTGREYRGVDVTGIVEGETVRIHVDGRDGLGHPMDYQALNLVIRKIMMTNCRKIVLEGVLGQRYIGSAASRSDLKIEIHGTPGNNLGAFLDGPTIEVFGNAQDLTGNTMNSGRIIVHGNAWDVTGLAARGGVILIKGDTGYRVGIHMKEFEGMKPSIVIGGTAKDYLGEYMAGGTIVVLRTGIDNGKSPIGYNIGAGMHGGNIYVRGQISHHQLGRGAVFSDIVDDDVTVLERLIHDYEEAFKIDVSRDWSTFSKVCPNTYRPFLGHYDPTLI
jgi:glutamate synthase domain-containing protein 3